MHIQECVFKHISRCRHRGSKSLYSYAMRYTSSEVCIKNDKSLLLWPKKLKGAIPSNVH